MTRKPFVSRRPPAAVVLLVCGVFAIVQGAAAQTMAPTILHEWRGINQPGPYSDDFGRTMAGLGDVDGDGVPDVVVGAPSTNVGTMAYAGRLYVYSGKGHTLFTLDGWTTDNELGMWLASAGDVDRDGHADILVSSFYTIGPPPLLAGVWHTVSGRTGTIVQSHVGYGVSPVNSSGPLGNLDMLRTTFNSSQTPLFAGLVELISGQSGAVIYSYAGTYAYQFLGAGGRAGDVDGDGIHDLLLAARGSTPFGTGPYGIWVYSGSTGGLLYRVPPSLSTGIFPAFLTGVGDVNGDGFDDVASSNTAGTHINIFAGPTGAPLPILSNPPPQNRIGDSLSAVGDVDGDGFDDVLTGGLFNGGRAILFSGQNQSVLAFVTEGTPLQGPYNTAGVSDTNGDDFPDYVYGPFGDYVLMVSVVRLYSGAPTGVSTLGIGCSDSRNIIPRIGCTYVPRRGQPFALNLSRVRSGVPAILVLGQSTVAPPLDLSILGAPGCYLRASADALSLASTNGPTGKGRAAVSMTIPNNPALVGSIFYAQWLVIEPPGSPTVASTTRALKVTIQ